MTLCVTQTTRLQPLYSQAAESQIIVGLRYRIVGSIESYANRFGELVLNICRGWGPWGVIVYVYL